MALDLQNTQTQTIRLQLDGLSCAGCVGRAERALSGVDGVQSATVNLASGKADVSMAMSTSVDAIEAALSKAGYPAIHSDDETAIDGRHERAAEDLRRAFWLALVLTLPVFLIEMGGHLYPPFHHWVAQTIGLQTSRVLQFLLTTAVLIGPGRVFFTKGIPALLRGSPEMNSLVSLGALSAWGYSTLTTFAPHLIPAASRNIYFESAAMIVTLILLGRMLEARAKGRAGDAIRQLIALQPDTAFVKRGDEFTAVAIKEIVLGDEIQAHPGDKLAVDGVVVTGSSWVDESMITGESAPVQKAVESNVTGGTINGTGAFVYRATAVGHDTMLARIITMVEDAQGTKLPVQALVDKITMWFVPVVLGLAALTVMGWYFFGPEPALANALTVGVAVLIIACPCAMGLATPTSIMVGTGRAAELGVLFRRGDALQALQSVDVIALDKTGTLTQGRPELTDMILADGYDRETVLADLAAVESQSEHPISRAITAAYSGKIAVVSDFQSVTGKGARGRVGARDIIVGADRFLQAEGIDISGFADDAQALGSAGKTPLYGAIDGVCVALLAVSDPIKETTPAAIKALQHMGLKVVMISGDNAATAAAIGGRLGIDDIRAEVLPDGKVAAIHDLGGAVAYVGDGINDAPALASATVGIAVGTGTDVAIQSADVVLMSGDLGAVVRAFTISRETMRNIRQNLFWAFGYNVVLIPIAAGILYPAFGILLSPMLAAGAMALSSVFVVTNALRLRRIKGDLL